MKIKEYSISGAQFALEAMRAPYMSWDRADTKIDDESDAVNIGPNDCKLCRQLATAGPEHCKHLRLIVVHAVITAPRYWWVQFDTYRTGVEKVSTSTMHTLTKRDLTPEDFEGYVFPGVIDLLNSALAKYRREDVPEMKEYIWRSVIQNLPQSYLQARYCMMSYAALRAMYHQRKNHKLQEWHKFCEWIEGLPESWMITAGLE